MSLYVVHNTWEELNVLIPVSPNMVSGQQKLPEKIKLMYIYICTLKPVNQIVYEMLSCVIYKKCYSKKNILEVITVSYAMLILNTVSILAELAMTLSDLCIDLADLYS